MKILHIVNSLSQGGVESLLADILPGMVSAEHSIEVLVLDKRALGLRRTLEERGVKVHPGRYGRVYDPRNILIIRRSMRRYDVVHVHHFPVQYYAVFAKWLCGGKHGVLITTEHSTLNHRRKHLVLKPVEWLIYRNYARVVSISNGAARNLKRWAGVESTVIYNGINLDRFRETNRDGALRRALGLRADDIVAVMVARFVKAKDQETVIRALALLPSVCKLILVGGGERLERCRALARKLGIGSRVLFVGHSSTPERYVAASDIGLLSSHWEGFGLSAIEYMAQGKPTVVSDVSGLGEAVADGALLALPQSAEDLAVQIDRLITDPVLYRQMSEKALQRARELDVRRTAAQYMEMYRSSI